MSTLNNVELAEDNVITDENGANEVTQELTPVEDDNSTEYTDSESVVTPPPILIEEVEVTKELGVAVMAVRPVDGSFTDLDRYVIRIGDDATPLEFQQGDLGTAADGSAQANGILNETLLELLKHRITHLNADHPCDENVEALAGIDTALIALRSRFTRVSAE